MAFVNEALIASSAQLEREIYEAKPLTTDERAWTAAVAVAFVGDDDEDWDALFPSD